MRTLEGLGIEDAVRMEAVRARTVVAHHDAQDVTHLAPQHRPEQAEMDPFRRPRLQAGERAVGIFAVEDLLVCRADPIGRVVDVELLRRGEDGARQAVRLDRIIIPIDRVDADIGDVRPEDAADRGGERGRIEPLVEADDEMTVGSSRRRTPPAGISPGRTP